MKEPVLATGFFVLGAIAGSTSRDNLLVTVNFSRIA